MEIDKKELAKANEKLTDADVNTILQWTKDTFGDSFAFTTAFGYSGIAILHHALKFWPDMKIYFIDTGFHFKETLEFKDYIKEEWNLNLEVIKPDITKYAIKNKEWALTGCKNRKPRIVRSLYLKKGALEQRNLQLQQNYRVIEKEEVRSETFKTQSAEVLIIAYGSMFRLVKEIILQLRRQGKKIGGFRPVTLWPFPYKHLSALVRKNKIKKILVIEMSCGQMLEDVKLSVLDRAKIYFYGRTGGEIPEIKDIISFIKTRKIA